MSLEDVLIKWKTKIYRDFPLPLRNFLGSFYNYLPFSIRYGSYIVTSLKISNILSTDTDKMISYGNEGRETIRNNYHLTVLKKLSMIYENL